MSRRAAILVLAAAVPVAAAVVAIAVAYWPESTPARLAAPVRPILPDLAMSPLTDVTSGVAPDGKQYVSFTASIGNVGPGPFIVHAVRGDQRGSWRVSQRFRERDAPTSEVVTPGTMVTGTPASTQASTSSPPRPKTYGSPPLSRTTNRPARATRS